MYKFIRPLIFNASSDPETMHRVVMKLLSLAGRWPFCVLERAVFDFQDRHLSQKVFGLEFKNPVGLAGGFDKQAQAVAGLANLGFGFLEIGTVTAQGQMGNPRPRIFRLLKDEALINRMGFNNHGADELAKKLPEVSLSGNKVPLGINIGKTKMTELQDAAKDYLYSFSKLYSLGDYFVVNVSSPNTPGLRQLINRNYLAEILAALSDYRSRQPN
ncbi:MAG: quinone-dependent dihydroorotate dehydrogenase, partial [Patescibacteria group bacterium]|nr:quinone-dependent dihydroorotate dehydrogenase [Patescibacteria group bacterium]